MQKKILVAVGNCDYSQHVVRYIAKLSSAATDLTYTLFNVQPAVPELLVEAAKSDPKAKAEIAELVRVYREPAGKSVQNFKEIMMQEGIPERRIEAVIEPIQEGIAKDILNWADKHGHDAIVLARRGLTPSRDFFIGTIAAKVIEHAIKIPVWVAAGEEISMKIMLAIDGSENSLRVVDHAMQMVGARPDLRLTLFHVLPHLRHYYSIDFEIENPHLHEILQREDKLRMEDFYERAHERLKAAGLKKSQIEFKTSIQSYDISTGILGEVKTGQYGTVVIGRRGEREAFFTGRIAMRLVQKVSDQALWVVP